MILQAVGPSALICPEANQISYTILLLGLDARLDMSARMSAFRASLRIWVIVPNSVALSLAICSDPRSAQESSSNTDPGSL